MRRIIVAGLFAAGITLGGASAASADPPDLPSATDPFCQGHLTAFLIQLHGPGFANHAEAEGVSVREAHELIRQLCEV